MAAVTDKTGMALLPSSPPKDGEDAGAGRLRVMVLKEESDKGVEQVIFIWSTKEALIDKSATCHKARGKNRDPLIVDKEFVTGRQMKEVIACKYGYAPSAGLVFVHARKTTPKDAPWKPELAQYAKFDNSFMQAVWLPKEIGTSDEVEGEGTFLLFQLSEAYPLSNEGMHTFLTTAVDSSDEDLMNKVRKLVYLVPDEGCVAYPKRMMKDFMGIVKHEGIWEAWEPPVALKKLYGKAELSIMILPPETLPFDCSFELSIELHPSLNYYHWLQHRCQDREEFADWHMKMKDSRTRLRSIRSRRRRIRRRRLPRRRRSWRRRRPRGRRRNIKLR